VSRLAEPLAEATRHQPAARAALAATLARPAHAYLFAGPRGSGKRLAARAFVAELLAADSPDPDEARRRVMLDPSPHPDLVWLRPPGTQHLVDEVRDRVIAQVAYRPFEGGRRVFVIEAAEAMGEESQNALLKTLEEPPAFAHLILLVREQSALLETVVSRCHAIRFAALSPDAVEERLAAAGAAEDPERRAAARLCGGDAALARELLSEPGRELRAGAEACVRAARAGRAGEAPWLGVLANAERAGERAAEEAEAELRAGAEASGDPKAAQRSRRPAAEAARRAGRRRRTETLDLALAVCGTWMRDLAATAEGAPELVYNADRREPLSADADGLDPIAARRAAELILDTRARLRVNVSEELALEALFYRIEGVLS
jgi:DNA polymerase-3 subunit delta'